MSTTFYSLVLWKSTPKHNLSKSLSSHYSDSRIVVRCCTGSPDHKPRSFKNSELLFNAAKDIMPGGVSSPVRAFTSVGGNPVVMKVGKGSKLWDVDGNEYIDFQGSFGVNILGHANDEICAILNQTAHNGTCFGAPCALENELAKLIIAAVPSVEMIRFVNSGTEAAMGVIRLARAFTGREKIIKFEGCYHGHADSFLVKSGSGQATLNLPDSPGVPKSVASETLTCPYNDISRLVELLETHDGEIAAVIVEPVVGNSGFIAPKDEFHEKLRDVTYKYGTLLIFDEVMTGFRVSYGGAQGYFNITPDLTIFAKIIGGGLPVGAYGGRREIMEMVAPAGPVYQAGTLSGNPLAMAAGIQTLKILKEGGRYEYLDQITSKFVSGLLRVGKKAGHAICGGHIGGMFGIFFSEGPVCNFEDAKRSDTRKFSKFHRRMLEEGIYFPPSPYEAGFTSLAHSLDDIERAIQVAEKVFQHI